MEFNDPAWQFFAVVLATIDLILSTSLSIIYFRKQNRKGLAYEVLSNKLMLVISHNTVIDGNSIDLRIWNCGSIPILEADHSDIIKLEFGSQAHVRKVVVKQTNPPGINMVPKPQGNSIVFERPIPTLNEKDSITLNVQVTQSGGEIEPSCRIAGVKKIVEQPQFLKRSIQLFCFLTVGFFLYFFLTTLFASLPHQKVIYQNYDLGGVLIIWLVWLIYVYDNNIKIILTIIRSIRFILFLLINYYFLHYVIIFILFYYFKLMHP